MVEPSVTETDVRVMVIPALSLSVIVAITSTIDIPL